MSVTFAAVTPMIAIGMNPAYRPAGDFWRHYRRGFYHHYISATIGRLMPLFPPLVTCVVITSIGLSIIQVDI
ncbi:solute carrier family 23 protein [Shigella flexneri]